MSKNDNYYYRRKPKAFTDMALGKGFFGDISRFLLLGVAGAALYALGVGLYTAATFSAFPVASIPVIAGVAAGFGAGALLVGRLANNIDDNNKRRRYNKYRKEARIELEKEIEGLPLEKQIEVLRREEKINKKQVHDIEEYFNKQEAINRMKAAEEKRASQEAIKWISDVHADIEKTDELEKVARAR